MHVFFLKYGMQHFLLTPKCFKSHCWILRQKLGEEVHSPYINVKLEFDGSGKLLLIDILHNHRARWNVGYVTLCILAAHIY